GRGPGTPGPPVCRTGSGRRGEVRCSWGVSRVCGVPVGRAVPILGQRVSQTAPRAVPPVPSVEGVGQRACHTLGPVSEPRTAGYTGPDPIAVADGRPRGRDVSGGSIMT